MFTWKPCVVDYANSRIHAPGTRYKYTIFRVRKQKNDRLFITGYVLKVLPLQKYRVSIV
jgi:hypothetical protein